MITIWVPKRLVEVGLYNVAARSPAELAALSEQSYRERVRYAAEKVRFSGTKIVMLTGPSASGKTTSAHKLAEELEQAQQTAVQAALAYELLLQAQAALEADDLTALDAALAQIETDGLETVLSEQGKALLAQLRAAQTAERAES